MDIQFDDTFDDREELTYRWCWWPRRCQLSGRWLFATKAVRGQATWTGPGDPIVETRWYGRHEALIKMMRGS